jgi:GT2 family glycosyltransferase
MTSSADNNSDGYCVPYVSVISIARSMQEFDPLIEVLNQQTYRDYEFVGEAGGSIPEAWNRAIRRACGEILIFTETDAHPVNEHWLEELVASAEDEHTIVKGLEVTQQTLDLANLAIHRSAFINFVFDEEYKWAEDMELFCRLKTNGYKILQIEKAPVVHLQKQGSKHAIRRAFRYGIYHSRLRHRYGNVMEIGDPMIQLRLIAMAGLKMAGFLVGYLIYWPERLWKKRPRSDGEQMNKPGMQQ